MTTTNKKSLILGLLLAFFPLTGFATATKLDIVWVVDNSGSMVPHQNSLAETTEGFLGKLLLNAKSKLDIRMGLLSTDIHDRPYSGFMPYVPANGLTPSRMLAQFQDGINRLGIDGNAMSEEAFRPLHFALTTYSFLREDSKLVVIVISDEEEQGNMGVGEFLSFLYSIRNYDSLSTYGLFDMSNLYGAKGEFAKLSRYKTVIQATGGTSFSIHDSFGKSLAGIADHMITRLNL